MNFEGSRFTFLVVSRSKHVGFGETLIQLTEEIAQKKEFGRLAVIPAISTRRYHYSSIQSYPHSAVQPRSGSRERHTGWP
jgi:hypothetical protein